jgi:PAS domain S-box-containing protein
MNDKYKTKAQLVQELQMLRKQEHRVETLDKHGQTEKETFKNNDTYYLLFNSIQDAIFVYYPAKKKQPGTFIEVNESACRLLGYSKSELLGLSPSDITAGSRAGFSGTGSTAYELSDQKEIVVENTLISKEGSHIPVEISSRLFAFQGKLATLSIARDIRERKQIEDETKLKALLLDRADDSIILADYNGNIVFTNEVTYKSRGYTRQEMLNMKLDQFVLPEYFNKINQQMSKSFKVPYHRIFQSADVRKDGSVMPVELHVSLIEYKNNIHALCIVRDISKRKKIEKELKLKARLLDSATDAIILRDFDGNIIYANEASYKSRGFSKKELMSMNIRNVVSPEYLYLRSKQDIAMTKKNRLNFECDHYRKDGTRLPVEIHSRIFKAEGKKLVLSIARDISERKQIEEALLESENKYRTLVEYCPDGILSLDEEGFVTDCNHGASELAGITKKEILGKHINELSSNENEIDFIDWCSHLDSPDYQEAEFELSVNNNLPISVWAKKVPLYDERGRFRQAIIYLRDFAERKKLDQLKDEFIGFVSHQLCSPLTVIIGATQTALADESRLAKDKQRQLLQITVTEAEALYHMVSNLLELSRLQSNRLILDNEEIDVADAINNVITRIQHEYSDYQFVTNLAKDTPILYADPIRLELILYNIIENAVKYSPAGSKIRICTRANREEITFGVVDHGPGIPAYSLPKIFEPFQRVEESHVTPVKGAGLGLLVCKRLVEVHGGKIWAKSKKGHGSTFYFSLPIYGNNTYDNS